MLHPSANLDDPVRCDLQSASLVEYDLSISSYYIALSYAWGESSVCASIHVGSHQLSITRSLHSALQHIRDTKTALLVWADGICINQFDVIEKNTQVKQMGRIFALARHTIIFLGEGTPPSDQVMDVLCRAAHSTSCSSECSALVNNTPSRANKRSKLPDVPEDIRLLADQTILQRPWFTRVWVLQELVLSLDPWIQVGLKRVRWDLFAGMLINPRIPEHRIKVLVDMSEARAIEASWEFGNAQGVDEEPVKSGYLLKILSSRRSLGVTDPRDMVYAHLGLLGSRRDSTGHRNLFVDVNYGKSIREVYVDVAVSFLHSRSRLDILSHVEDVLLELRRKHLPSWVPDWTSPHVSVPTSIRSTTVEGTGDALLILQDAGILACTGSIDGMVEFIRDDMPPLIDLRVLLQQVMSGFPEGTSVSEAIGLRVYNHLYYYLQQWMGSENKYLPLMPTSRTHHRAGEFILGRLKAISNPELQSGHTTLPVVEPYRRHQDTTYYNSEVINYLILGMTDLHGPGCFPGKRMAFLDNGGIALVPHSTRVGDILCTLDDNYGPYVARKTTDIKVSDSPQPSSNLPNIHDSGLEGLDAKVISFFTKSRHLDSSRFASSNSEAKVENFHFIGAASAWMQLRDIPLSRSASSTVLNLFAFR
ncbi:heterokaryon incompatibility protein-domain-containing protein [Leptodontidium sp. 2 PMI_412]|nr:heterokaryon incompatibility protein-domain-containing protein [Leptodontidium sp. 2 PMI_412]